MIQLRSSEDSSTAEIDMRENGIFLDKSLHSKISRGEVALIKV